jgi:hypothetical protein
MSDETKPLSAVGCTLSLRIVNDDAVQAECEARLREMDPACGSEVEFDVDGATAALARVGLTVTAAGPDGDAGWAPVEPLEARQKLSLAQFDDARLGHRRRGAKGGRHVFQG